MRLLMLTWNYPPTVGGIEQVAGQLAEGLCRQGVNITVLAAALPPGISPDDRDSPLVLRSPRPGLLAFLWHAFRTGLRIARRDCPDALICPSLTSAPAAWLISRMTGVPYALLIHGSDIMVDSRGYQLIIRPLLAGATLLFANSRNTARLLEQKGLPHKQIRVVCPGMTPPPAPFDPPTSAIRSLLESTRGRTILLTVGRLVKRKGILEFIERSLPALVAAHPDLLYLVVGDEPKASLIHHERIMGELEAAIDAGGHRDRVRLLGRLSDADLDAVYRQARVFVLPCLDHPNDVEGFGIVILEAAWHGVPSVATRCGGIPDAIEENRTGLLVRPGNFDALAATVQSLLDDPKRAASLGAQARERATSGFSWDTVTARYRKEMEDMVAQ